MSVRSGRREADRGTSDRGCTNSSGNIIREYPAFLSVAAAFQAQLDGGSFTLGNMFSNIVQYKGAYA